MNSLKIEKSKRFLFNTQFHWPYSAVDYSVAMALRARGHEVAMVACGYLPFHCKPKLIAENAHQDMCDNCAKTVIADFEKFNLPYYTIRDNIRADDIKLADNIATSQTVAELRALEFRGIPVGRIAWLNMFAYYQGHPFEMNGEKEDVFRAYIRLVVLTSIGQERVWNHYNPDMVITTNGKYSRWAPFVHIAKQKGADFATWEDSGITPYAVIYELNGLAHEQRIDSVWADESKKPLTEQQRQKILGHFSLWKAGKCTPYPCYDQTIEENAGNIRKMLNLRPGSPIVSLFTNVAWDSSSVGFDYIFESMYHWVFAVVAHAKKYPDVEFVIRAHPAEYKIPLEHRSSTPICKEVLKRFSDLPPNVKLIDNTSPISSYALGDMSDVVMVYTSTLGIEFALRGIRPWVASKPYYSGKGFTLDMVSPQHMFELLDNNTFDNKLTPEQIELAERFAYIVRFRRLISFPYLDGPKNIFAPPDLSVFEPGGNPVIDNLCNYILHGKPFLDIGNSLECKERRPKKEFKREKFFIDQKQNCDWLDIARKSFEFGDYNKAFDIYEQLYLIYPEKAIQILAEAYDKYSTIMDNDRYVLYQSRFYDFNIQPGQKVLDIGSGHHPLKMATHLADVAVEDDNYGRAGVPFKYLDNKPVYECNVEKMPFGDKEFDFVYCSHVLEHAANPDRACNELMRIAKRGYIETPAPHKDMMMDTAKLSNHLWAVELRESTLVFTQYSKEQAQGLGSNILLEMHCSPQTEREKAFSALIYLRPELFNTMLLWNDSFEFQITRLDTDSIKENSVENFQNTRDDKNLAKEIYQQGILHLEKSDALKAVELFDKANKYCDNLPGLNFARAIALAKIGNVDKSQQACELELRLHPDNTEAKKFLDRLNVTVQS